MNTQACLSSQEGRKRSADPTAPKHTLVQQAFARDFTLPDDGDRALDSADLVRLSQFLSKTDHPIAYTAFDGDHFALTPLMRSYVLSHDVVPANPESILGYKDTVDKHQNKFGVLRDDLAVLRGCDQLWIFTDVEPGLGGVPYLAEGVLTELLYYVLSRGRAVVHFVPVVEILLGRSPKPIEVSLSVDELANSLDGRQFEQLLEFLGGPELSVRDELPPVAFVAMDPLDSKYMSWIRPFALGRSKIAIVPGLAIELGDVVLRQGEMGCLLISWVTLMRLAGELWVLPSMDSSRKPSNTVSLLESSWRTHHSSQEVVSLSWKDVGVPKALQGRAWPLTEMEGGVR